MDKPFPPHIFNPYSEEIPEALSIRFNNMVYQLKREGKDVIVLSLGEAFFDIPLFDFHKIDYNKGYHYSESLGIPELRKKIADYYLKHYGARINPDNEIIISAGSKICLFMAMLAILQNGEEIVVHEPCWLSYPHQAHLCGGKTRFIPYDVPVQDFPKYMTPRSRILIINNPNNPMGRVYSREELSFLYENCARRGIYLLIDEAYSDFVLDDSFYTAMRLNESKEFLIVVNSLSKNMGMSGWRIGYTIAHPEFIRVLLKINQHLITCAPTVLLQYIERYFEDILKHTLPQVKAVVEKRERIKSMLTEVGLTALPGSSTFYFFVSLGEYPGTSMEFATELLNDHYICVVPGSAYGKSTDHFIRVSIGTESMDRIRFALEKIKEKISQTKTSGSVFSPEENLSDTGPSVREDKVVQNTPSQKGEPAVEGVPRGETAP
jgi:aspartate aminotransferase/aminotransferase